MSEEATIDKVGTDAPATGSQAAAAPTPAAAPAPATSAAAQTPAPAPAELTPPAVKADKTAAAALDDDSEGEPDKPDWREQSIRSLLGEPKADEPADVKKQREKLTKLAQRYTDTGQLLKALHETQAFIGKTRKTEPLPADATPEQIKAWREERGIPETPDGYDLKLPKGFVWADADKPLVEQYLTTLHAQHATPEEVARSVSAYAELRAKAATEQMERDTSDSAATITSLKEEWGGDYRGNLAGVQSLLNQAPTSVAEALRYGRGPDGTALGNHPDVLRWLAQQARIQGYVGATVVPSGTDPGKSIDDEIRGLEAKMYTENGAPNPAYWKDERAQKQYRELLEARSKIKRD